MFTCLEISICKRSLTRRIALILIIFSSTRTCSGQYPDCFSITFINNAYYIDTVSKIPFTGKCISYYSDGNKMAEKNFTNGMKEGTQNEWYKSGNIKEEEHYKNGMKDSIHTEWYENGKLSEQKEYQNGYKQGKHKEWYIDGKLKEEKIYLFGKLNNKHKIWNEHGQLIELTNYSYGIKHGKALQWYDDGQKRKVKNYKHGEKHGKFIEWYSDGEIMKIRYYRYDLRNGIRREYDKNGTLIIDEKYINDRIIGDTSKISDKGVNLYAKEYFKAGTKHARTILKLIQKRNYEKLYAITLSPETYTDIKSNIDWAAELLKSNAIPIEYKSSFITTEKISTGNNSQSVNHFLNITIPLEVLPEKSKDSPAMIVINYSIIQGVEYPKIGKHITIEKIEFKPLLSGNSNNISSHNLNEHIPDVFEKD